MHRQRHKEVSDRNFVEVFAILARYVGDKDNKLTPHFWNDSVVSVHSITRSLAYFIQGIPVNAVQRASGNVLKLCFTSCMEDLSDCSCCKIMIAKIVRYYSRKQCYKKKKPHKVQRMQ